MKRATLKEFRNGTWIVGTVEEKKGKKEKKMNPCLGNSTGLQTEKLDVIAKIFSWQFIAFLFYSSVLAGSILLNLFQFFYIQSLK